MISQQYVKNSITTTMQGEYPSSIVPSAIALYRFIYGESSQTLHSNKGMLLYWNRTSFNQRCFQVPFLPESSPESPGLISIYLLQNSIASIIFLIFFYIRCRKVHFQIQSRKSHFDLCFAICFSFWHTHTYYECNLSVRPTRSVKKCPLPFLHTSNANEKVPWIHIWIHIFLHIKLRKMWISLPVWKASRAEQIIQHLSKRLMEQNQGNSSSHYLQYGYSLKKTSL